MPLPEETIHVIFSKEISFRIMSHVLSGSRFAGVCLLLVIFGAASASMAAEPVTQSLCGGLVRLAVPTQWSVEGVGTQGAVLQPPGTGQQPIEVVLWPVPQGGDGSAVAAAAAQETLLFRRSPYSRRRVEPCKTHSGLEGLLVYGEVKDKAGAMWDSVFVAFAERGRYCVIGTFVSPGTADAAMTGPFGDIVNTVELLTSPVSVPSQPIVNPTTPLAPPSVPAIPPASVPATSPAPQEPSSPPPPVPSVPIAPLMPVRPLPAVPQPLSTSRPAAPLLPQSTTVLSVSQPHPGGLPEPQPLITALQPATAPLASARLTPEPPPVSSPAPAPTVVAEPLEAYQSPLGFTLQRPARWNVAVNDGYIEIAQPTEDGSGKPGAAVLIWPLTGLTGSQDPAGLARKLLATWSIAAVGTDGLAIRQSNQGVVLAGTVGATGAGRRLVACCWTRGESGLLTALAIRPEDFTASLPTCLKILASFQAGPWWIQRRDVPQTVIWQDPSSNLRAPVPSGWKVRGGLQSFNGMCSLYLEGTSQDERRLSFLWQQPIVPLFHELTQMLRNLGWQEGDKYLSNPGDQQVRILTRLSPQDFLTKYWLQTPQQRLDEVVLDKFDMQAQTTSLLPGENSVGAVAVLHGQTGGKVRQRYCVVATANAPSGVGGNCWQAGVLQCEAPTGALDEALEALRTAVNGAEIAAGSTVEQVAAAQQLLQGARQALAALPVSQRQTPPTSNIFAGLGEAGKGTLWLLPVEGLQPWQRACDRLAAQARPGDAVPELRLEFWK